MHAWRLHTVVLSLAQLPRRRLVMQEAYVAQRSAVQLEKAAAAQELEAQPEAQPEAPSDEVRQDGGRMSGAVGLAAAAGLMWPERLECTAGPQHSSPPSNHQDLAGPPSPPSHQTPRPPSQTSHHHGAAHLATSASHLSTPTPPTPSQVFPAFSSLASLASPWMSPPWSASTWASPWLRLGGDNGDTLTPAPTDQPTQYADAVSQPDLASARSSAEISVVGVRPPESPHRPIEPHDAVDPFSPFRV